MDLEPKHKGCANGERKPDWKATLPVPGLSRQLIHEPYLMAKHFAEQLNSLFSRLHPAAQSHRKAAANCRTPKSEGPPPDHPGSFLPFSPCKAGIMSRIREGGNLAFPCRAFL
jgi:hypothetical protein